MILVAMVGMGGIAPPGVWKQALGVGLLVLALSACASTPAPVSAGRGGREPAWNGPRVDADGAHVADPAARLQCVPYARQASGIEIYGNANTWWAQAEGRYPRSNTPAEGSVLVMRGYNTTARGHVAVVADIVSERIILVDHANWLNRGEISVSVPVLDVSPNNDWSQVRVWHIPGGHWGGRVYQAEGYIHGFSLRGLFA